MKWLRGPGLVKARLALSEGVTGLLFERRLHARTSGRIELADLGVPSEYRVQYEPSPWLTLPRVLKRSEISSHDVFIDLGCGMGRMVLEAAILYRFARVIGVEISPDLARVAQENVDRNRHRLKAREVEVVTSDVLDYQIPDDVTIAFLYNPFYGPIFVHVIRELIASVDRAPRRLRIVYQNLYEEATLLSSGRVRRIRNGRSLVRPGGSHPGLALYEIAPPTGVRVVGPAQPPRAS